MNGGYGGLTITDVTLEDAGNYTCYVTLTGLVKAKVSTELSVVQSVVVSMEDVDAIESQSRNVNILCNYTPKQEIIDNINWYKITLQGTKLFLASSNEPRRSDRFEASQAAGVGRLKIMDPVSGDEGCYQCEVIRKNKCAAFYAHSVLTLPVRVFPYHRESSSISTSYRRPAIVSFVQANHYHLLAFCEKRRRTATSETRSIVMLRAVVRSRTIEWDKQQTVVYSKEIDAIPPQRSPSNLRGSYKPNPNTAWPENPVPVVVNQKRGHIVVLFNTFTSSLRAHQRSSDWKLYSAHSKDGGKTWPILNQHFPWSNNKTRKDNAHLLRPPRHFELSPGHGIKLSSGTLLVNGFTSTSTTVSDDKKSKRHDQSVLVQVILTGGKDGMEWNPVGKSRHESSSDTLPSCVNASEGIDEELNASLPYENVHLKGASRHAKYFASPGCQAGLVSFKAYIGEDSKHSPTWVLCSKQIKPSDKKFSVRLSKDGCNTWSKESLVLKDGQVGNSDLAYFERCDPASKKTIRMCGCLYESVSKKDGTERLTLVFNTFKLSSLLQDEEM
ncbi:uncharacterized protein LOC117121679 [Anneissia japonica]|uniref:uncharacterized protein LOC117121679 n=1 Tax=Anneissia japonica TaxID=1529436 RepID=UPI00142575C1|nr:uncharacterized protein LOC117121679 [Anneissia japonica]